MSDPAVFVCLHGALQYSTRTQPFPNLAVFVFEISTVVACYSVSLHLGLLLKRKLKKNVITGNCKKTRQLCIQYLHSVNTLQ